MSQSKRSVLQILVVRVDRIGDVVLSTPVFDVLKRHYPRSHITVLVRESAVSLVRGLPSVDDVMVFDPTGRHAGLSGLFYLMREFRERGVRIALVLQSHWKIAAALFGAGVSHRIGPLSKLYSFLFFNRGIRQRRSQVEMHEADYNLQLLRRLGIRVGTRNVPTRVVVKLDAIEHAKKWLAEKGWTPLPQSRPLVLVHPGMGGSALNWPIQHYSALIQALAEEGFPVLVSGGPEEKDLIGQLKGYLGPVCEKLIFYLSGARFARGASVPGNTGSGESGVPSDSLEFFMGLVSCVDLVIAPSTGPLHLAVALGKPVVTFYPPIRVQSALRWGPYLADESRASILVPEVYCGQDFACRGPLCNYYPCMESISVTQTLQEVHRQLAHLQNRGGKENG